MRTIIYSVLIVGILGATGFVVWGYFTRGADYYWQQAQEAMEAEDFSSAEVNLRNLLKEQPDHIDGHEALAKVLLEKAEAEDRPADYENNPEALNELAIVARARPEDAELQKQLLRIYMRRGAIGSAARVAERVIKLDPNDTDALYILASRAVRSKNPRASELLDRLMELPSLQPFRTLELAEDYYENDEQRRQEVLTRVVQTADQIDAEQLQVLSERERAAMSRLLYKAVETAPDLETAERRTAVLLSALEKKSSLEDANLSETADAVSQAVAMLRERYPLPEDATQESRDEREQVAAKAQEFRKRAIDSGNASPAVYYQSALEAFLSEDYGEAVTTLEKGIETAEDLPEERKREILPLRLLQARSQLILRKYDEASVQLEKILEHQAADNRTLGWAHLLAGGVDTADGRHEKALDHYLNAQKKMGQNLLVKMALANTNLLLKRWEEALLYLSELSGGIETGKSEERFWAAQHNITNASIHWGQARAHLALDEWKDAKPHLDALQGTKHEARATATACLYLWSKERRSEAQQLLAEGRKKLPGDLTLLQVQLGFLKALGRTEDANHLIEQAATAAPKDLTRQLMQVRWLIGKGEHDQAVEMLDKLEKEFPEDSGPQVVRARYLLSRGEAEQALEIANALQQSPDTKAVGSLIAAAAQMKTKNLSGASAELQSAREASQRHGALSLLQSRVAVAEGDYAQAVENLSESLDVTALRGQSRFELLRSILLLAQKEGLDEAERHLQPVLEKHPEDPFPVIILADLRFKQGKFQEGMNLLDKVDRLQPGLPNAAYLKAGAYLQVGQIEKCLEELRRALQTDETHLPSLVMAAEVSLLARNNRDAERYCREALKINAQLWNLYLIQADAVNNQGRFEEAVEIVERVIQKQPKFLRAHRGLIALFNANSRPELALKACERGRQLLPDAFQLVTDEIALRYRIEGQGLNAAEEVAEKAAGEADAAEHLQVARVFAALQEFEVAERWGMSALALATDKQEPAVHLFLGELALHQAEDDPEKNALARDHFASVLAFPSEPDKFSLSRFVAGNNLAWLLSTEFDKSEEAVEVVEQVRGKWGIGVLPVGFLDTLAEVYRRADRLEEAQSILDRALETRPDEAKLLYQRGLLWAARKRPALARNDLDRALQLGLPEKREEKVNMVLTALNEADNPEPDNVNPEPGKPGDAQKTPESGNAP